MFLSDYVKTVANKAYTRHGCDGYLYRDIMRELYEAYQASETWRLVVTSVKDRDNGLCVKSCCP